MAKYVKKINSVVVVGTGGGGGGITALTGDVTASGAGSVIATLATVNSNIGTFNNVTVNAKGLVTSASNVPYLTAEVDTLQTVTGRGASSNIAIALTNATASTTTTTGALVVAGGVGIQGKLNGNNAQFLGSVIADGGGFIYLGGTSSQFLKADGSRDSNTYLTSLTGAFVVGGQTLVANDKLGSINSVDWDLVSGNESVIRVKKVAGTGVNFLSVTNAIDTAGAGGDITLGYETSAGSATGNFTFRPLSSGGLLRVFPVAGGSTRILELGGQTIRSFDGVTNQIITTVSPWVFNGASTSSSTPNIQFASSIAGATAVTRAYLDIVPSITNTNGATNLRGINIKPSISNAAPGFVCYECDITDASNRFALRFLGTGRSDFGGNINLNGTARVTTYAGNTTVGNGVASILGTFSVIGRTTAYTAQSIMTIPTTGVYEIVVGVNNSSPANFTNLTLNYTSGGIGQTHDKFNLYTVGFRSTETYLISCDASTALTFTTVLAGATTHDITIYVKRIA